MSGAAESILQDILTQASISNVHLANMLRNAAASGGSGSSSSAAKEKEASKSLQDFKKSVESTKTAYSNTIVSIYGFSKAASLGEAKLGEFYAAFKGTPIIGTFFGLLGDMYSYQETILESWKNLSNVGATLGGSLTEVRNLAHASGLSISEFTEFVGKNSETLALFGSSVSSGTKKFVAAQAETRESMMALGYTGKESAEVLALFTRGQGIMNKQSMMSSLTQTEAAINFAKELKIASDLTGQSNEELRKQVEEAQADNAWQVYLSTITNPEEVKKLQSALNLQIAQNGKAGEKLFKEQAVTGAIQTASSAAFATATQNQAFIANQQILAMIRNGASEEEVRLASIRNQVKVVDLTKDLAVGLQGAYYSLQANGDELATVANTTLKNGTAFNDRYTKMTDEQIKTEGKKLDLSKSNAVDLQKQQTALRDFVTGFVDSVFKIIGPVVKPLQAFAEGILKIAASILPVFAKMVEKLASPEIMGKLTKIFTYLANVLTDVVITSITSFSNIIDGFAKGGFAGGLKAITSEIESFISNALNRWNNFGNETWPAIKDAGLKIYDAAKPLMSKIWEDVKPGLLEIWTRIENQFSMFFNKMLYDVKTAIVDFMMPESLKRIRDERIAQEERDSENRRLARGTGVTESSILDNAKDLANLILAFAGMGSRPKPEGRSVGSLGSTGKLFENWGAGTDVTLHGNEAVVTPAQMGGIINNSLAGELQTLNRQVAELLKYNKETAEYARRNVDATNSLSGNLFA